MKRGRVLLLSIIGVLLAISVVIGASYASWIITRTQTLSNTIKSDCFNVSFTEENNIALQNAYPLYDEDGKKLTPYTFTLTNTCSSYAAYEIQLEVLQSSTLKSEHLKIQLNDEEPVLLSSLDVGTPKLAEGNTAFVLKSGILNLEEEKTFTLRVWLDSTVTTETEGVQNTTWSAKITINTSYTTEEPTYCDANSNTGACQILAQGETEELKFDNTEDNNLRYIGANPNNYVTFNNELWRIIGVFNNIDNGSGTKETRLKIIRNEPIGNYSWDNKPSGTGSSDSAYGSNDWTDSALQEVLNNGPYWNRTSGNCPSGQNGATTACDFTTIGLSEEAKTTISDAVWNLGGSSTYNDVTASMFYERERGTTVYSGRPTKWTGKIGLMYPSDYGYATSGGSTTNREACLNKELYNWNSSSVSDCKNNDWLYNSSNYQWTLTSNSSGSNGVFYVYSNGGVYYIANNTVSAVSPALYLNSNVKISGGEGTESSPYQLSL